MKSADNRNMPPLLQEYVTNQFTFLVMGIMGDNAPHAEKQLITIIGYPKQHGNPYCRLAWNFNQILKTSPEREPAVQKLAKTRAKRHENDSHSLNKRKGFL